MVCSIGCAAMILSYSSFRDLVAPILFFKLCNRLRLYLSTILASFDELADDCQTTEEGRNLEDSWTDILNGPVLSVLLWVLYIGWNSSTYHEKNRAWFANQIARSCWQTEIASGVVLQEEIQRVMPQQALLNMKELWTVVSLILVSWTSMSYA